MLLIGASDVVASRRFYVEQGLEVAESFGRRYVGFAAPAGAGPFTDPDGFAWEPAS